MNRLRNLQIVVPTTASLFVAATCLLRKNGGSSNWASASSNDVNPADDDGGAEWSPNHVLATSMKKQQQQQQQQQQQPSPKLVFLGTGSSTGCPNPLCTMMFQQLDRSVRFNPEQEGLRKAIEPRCQVSKLAIQGNPHDNKNYRNNPSFLIQYPDEQGTMKHVIIDTGKTFREGALRWFPRLGISSIDAIVLTHHHMDAAAGLDDVRGFQRLSFPPPPPPQPQATARTSSAKNARPQYHRIPVPVHLSPFCYSDLQERFPWLLPKPKRDDTNDSVTMPNTINGRPIVQRDVASFQVHLFRDYQPFVVEGGLTITPLPVWHGDDLISHGFAFTVQHGTNSCHVVYLSDISRMIPETMDFIRNQLPPTDILVVDALLWHYENPVHYSFDQAMALQQQIKPRQTYLVGMNCDNFLPHDEMNAWLRSNDHPHVQMAHDGLVIEL